MNAKRKDKKLREQPLTYTDYAALPGDARYELAGGELELMSPAPSPRHQAVVQHLFSHLTDRCHTDYVIFFAPIDLILSDTEVRQPDLVMIHRDQMEIITKRGIEGIPNLVVEVLSSHSAKRDRQSKLRVYAEHGIPEYWIVDYAHQTLEQYTLTDAVYGVPRVYGQDDVVASTQVPCVALTMGQIIDAASDIPG